MRGRCRPFIASVRAQGASGRPAGLTARAALAGLTGPPVRASRATSELGSVIAVERGLSLPVESER